MNPFARKLQEFKTENRPAPDHPDWNAWEDYWANIIEEADKLERVSVELADQIIRERSDK